MTRTEKLFSFLIGNMKQMEIELRAQSMVLEAVAHKIIKVDQLDTALATARESHAMLDLVEHKYRLLAQESEPLHKAQDSPTLTRADINPVLIN